MLYDAAHFYVENSTKRMKPNKVMCNSMTDDWLQCNRSLCSILNISAFFSFYCRLPGVCCAIYPIAQEAASFTVGSNSSKQGTKVSRALLSTTA